MSRALALLMFLGVLLAACAGATQPERARVLLGGDVHGEGALGEALAAGENPLNALEETLHQADLVVVNLETPIASSGTAVDKAITFRAEPALAAALAASGVDVVSLANNHVLDLGLAGLDETRSLAAEAGLAVVGAGADAAVAAAPAILDTPAGRVAVLGLSTVVPHGWAAGPGPGVASALDPDAAVAAVRGAAIQADHVVVTIHWGNELRACPSVAETALADALAEAGADVVAGHHPHVVQGVTERSGALVAFSLGNLAFTAATAQTRAGALLEVTLDAEGVTGHRLVPLALDGDGAPTPARGPAADALRKTVATRSPGGGTCPAAVWDGRRR